MKFANTIALSLILTAAASPAVMIGSSSIQSAQAQEIESETMDAESAGEGEPAGTEAESSEITPSTDSSVDPDTGIGGAEPDTNVNVEDTDVQEEVNTTTPATQPVEGLW